MPQNLANLRRDIYFTTRNSNTVYHDGRMIY